MLTEEAAVGAAYRPGVARAEGGWLFSTNQALYVTEDVTLERVVENTAAIPPDLMAQGFDHIGDADIADGVLYAPLEQGDYTRLRQLMLEYDPATLEFVRAAEVAQAHNSWVSVDDGVAYSMSDFDGDDVLLRYDADSWATLEPLALSEAVARVQGGDVLDGFLWLSTDDPVDGIYRVDLTTGQVDRVGALSHPDGEGEGIDATDLPSGQLHAVSIDVALAPVWFQHFRLDG
jgi:hypothetical protein